MPYYGFIILIYLNLHENDKKTSCFSDLCRLIIIGMWKGYHFSMEGHNNKWKELLFYQKMVFTRVRDFTLGWSLLYILLLSSPQGSQLGIRYSMMPFRKGIWSFCSKVDLLNELGLNKYLLMANTLYVPLYPWAEMSGYKRFLNNSSP